MSTKIRELDESTFHDNGKSIYQRSLANAQVDNIKKANIPTINDITIEGTETGSFEANLDKFSYHFRAFYAGRGYGYEFFEPAYRYGFNTVLAHRYTGEDWIKQRSAMKREWEHVNPNTWHLVRDAVKHGWNRALDYRDLENGLR